MFDPWKKLDQGIAMKGFWVGVAVTVLVIAAFPALGRWVTTMPYRTVAMFNPAVGSPAVWQGGGGRGGRMTGGRPRSIPAGFMD